MGDALGSLGAAVWKPETWCEQTVPGGGFNLNSASQGNVLSFVLTLM